MPVRTDLKMAGKSIPSSLVFENGRLYVVPPGGGKMPLVAESDTTFSALGAPVIFRKDASRSGVYPGAPALIASRPWPCALVSRTLSA